MHTLISKLKVCRSFACMYSQSKNEIEEDLANETETSTSSRMKHKSVNKVTHTHRQTLVFTIPENGTTEDIDTNTTEDTTTEYINTDISTIEDVITDAFLGKIVFLTSLC